MKPHIGSEVNCGFIGQLVEERPGNAEVTGSHPVEALTFFRLLLSNCLNWKIYCDDHSSLSDIIYYFMQELKVLVLKLLWISLLLMESIG